MRRERKVHGELMVWKAPEGIIWGGRVGSEMYTSRRSAAGLTRILVALAVLATGIVIAPPAEAKVPSRTPERTIKCKNGKTAKIWWKGIRHVEMIDDSEWDYWEVTQFAVDNKCKGWLNFEMRDTAESESDCCHGVQVAPGANFTKTNKDVPSADTLWSDYGEPGWGSESAKECVDPDGGHNQMRWDVAKNGKVTYTEDCVRKYPESRYRSIGCPESWDPVRGHYSKRAFGVWKVDSKKILKLAVNNDCRTETIYWWRTRDGKRVALWIDEQAEFDLWKDELGPLPVKTKDGEVYFVNAPAAPPTAADLAAYDENWRISSDGRPYLWQQTK